MFSTAVNIHTVATPLPHIHCLCDTLRVFVQLCHNHTAAEDVHFVI